MRRYTCLACDLLFIRKLDRRQPAKYCSRLCANKSGIVDKTKSCPACLQYFTTYKKNQKYCSIDCFGKQYSKDNSHFWRGGVTTENELARKTKQYRTWRTQVFERDSYTCQECYQIGGSLVADHIKPFAYYEKLRYELSNGRTLCVECHYQTDTYGSKAFKYSEIAGK